MVEAGLTGLEIQSALSEAGMGVRRSDLLSLIRGLKDVELSRPYIASVRDDLRINPERLAPSLTRTLRNYSFNVALTGKDAETGETRIENVTISTSRLMTKAELKELALAMIPDLSAGHLGSGHLVGLEDAEATIQTGTRSPT
jgi:hypothetical protein